MSFVNIPDNLAGDADKYPGDTYLVKEKVNIENRASGVQNRMSILGEAQSVIYGDREKTYGSPDKNLQVIANLWCHYLDRPHGSITVDDVCNMMILLKVARLKNDPNHYDSQVDICGYAALMERVQTYRKGQNESILTTEQRNKLAEQTR